MDQDVGTGEVEQLQARVAELERALSQREEQFQRLSNHLPDVVAQLDRNLRHLYLNPAAERATKIPVDQCMGKTFEELGLFPETVAFWNEHIQKVFAGKQPHTMEFSYPSSTGTRHFHSLIVPVFAGDNSVESVFCVTRDITERREAEIALMESENKYRMLFNTLADIALVIDRETLQILDANMAACQVLGYSREELLALTILDISAEPEETSTAIAENQLNVSLRYYRKKDGTTFPVELRSSEFSLKGKRCLTCAARDISETLKWQARLQAELDLLDQIMNTSPVSIAMENREGQMTFANPQMKRLLNLDKDAVREIYNKPDYRITDYDGEPVPLEDLPFARIKTTQRPVYGIRQVIHWPDGRHHFLLINGAPLFDVDYQFNGVVLSMMDVTAQMEAEQALRASERQYRQLFEELPSGFALHEMICDEANNPVDYVFLQANPGFEKITGLAAKDILGRRAREVLPQLEPYWVEQYGRVALTGAPIQFDNFNADTGKYYQVHAFCPEPGQFAVIFSDITERKQNETRLSHYTQRLQVLHEIDHAILAARSVEEIAGASLRHLRVLIPTMQGSVTIFDFEGGQSMVLSAGETRKNSLPDPAWVDQLTPGQPLIVPDVLALPSPPSTLEDGVRAYMNVPMLAHGRLVGSLDLCSDQPHFFDSEQVEIALEVASQIAIAIQQVRLLAQVQHHADELELRVAERTAALQTANERLRAFARAREEFVSNVSHELRNPITSLKLREHLLLAHPENLTQHMEVIRRDTTRLERLIEDLLFLSRLDQGRQVTTLEPVDLNQLASHYLSDRNMLAQERAITLRLDPCPQLPLVQADFGLVEQALGILLTNAINYTPGGGRITVHTFLRENGDQKLAGFSVADTGPGIPPEERPYLFGRFFRGTVGRASGTAGTGLGLSIAQEIVDLHHGTIEVESTLGEGATFTICLPLTAETA